MKRVFRSGAVLQKRQDFLARNRDTMPFAWIELLQSGRSPVGEPRSPADTTPAHKKTQPT